MKAKTKVAEHDEVDIDDLVYSDESFWRGNDARRTEAVGDAGVSLSDFRAYMPMHAYIFMPARDLWPAASVNARLGTIPLVDADGRPVFDDNGKQKKIPASAWLDKHRPVEQMTWAPGLPMLISDRLMQKSGWIEHDGVTCFNLYLPPSIIPGDASKAGPWLDHVRKVYPDDADHLVKWFAHRVQRPQDKINHALVLGGDQGIGKDTLLEPVKRAVGPWNFDEASPQQALGRFNGFLKSVIMRINEARDLSTTHAKWFTPKPLCRSGSNFGQPKTSPELVSEVSVVSDLSLSIILARAAFVICRGISTGAGVDGMRKTTDFTYCTDQRLPKGAASSEFAEKTALPPQRPGR